MLQILSVLLHFISAGDKMSKAPGCFKDYWFLLIYFLQTQHVKPSLAQRLPAIQFKKKL
jgi:hypothetical protein